MKTSRNYPVSVIAAGFVVSVLYLLVLFWIRTSSETCLIEMMPGEGRYIKISPSGLVPEEIENDPNVIRHSQVAAHLKLLTRGPQHLGIFYFLTKRKFFGSDSDIYLYSDDGSSVLYFDRRSGLIIRRYSYVDKTSGEPGVYKKVQLYAGPEGVSEKKDKNLGRFEELLGARYWGRKNFVVYDKKHRRFFGINFEDRLVSKGDELKKDGGYEPVQIGELAKNSGRSNDLYWNPPSVRSHDNERHTVSIFSALKSGLENVVKRQKYLFVLDKSGRIDLLDSESLEFAGKAGFLPGSPALFASENEVGPKDLLSYSIFPVEFQPDWTYRGMCVRAVGREGTSMAVAVFDEKGKLIRKEDTKIRTEVRIRGGKLKRISSSRGIYFHGPWAPFNTIIKYLAENLHPPILSIVSYLTAESFEAADGHRALFVLPNSFIAMKSRSIRESEAMKIYSALLLIFPSIVLSGLLGWRVHRNGVVNGLSENVRFWWVIGTVCFGLVGYITYRLCRSKMTLVTCVNCGRLRRPDMEKCHRCGAGWEVAELRAPLWRVFG